jgi:hypothetical protein
MHSFIIIIFSNFSDCLESFYFFSAAGEAAGGLKAAFELWTGASIFSDYLDEDENALEIELAILPKNEPIDEDSFFYAFLAGMAIHFIAIYL